jgi:hypothetical protein
MTTTTKLNPNALQQELNAFSGSDCVYRHPFERLVYTEGVKFLADHAGAYWLIDALASYQSRRTVRELEIQFWRLKRDAKGDGAVLTCSYDIEHGEPVTVKVRQVIKYTDFPLPSIKLYVIPNGDGTVTCLLPGEY